MKQEQFLIKLEKGLKEKGLIDYQDIILDYENHFESELSKGRTEEEITASLGDISDILNEYDSVKKRRKFLITLSIQAIFWPIYIMLFALLIAIFSLSLATLLLTIYYLLRLDLFSFMPSIPLPISVLFSLAFAYMTYFFLVLSKVYYEFLKALYFKCMSINKSRIYGVKYAKTYPVDKKRLKLLKYFSIILFFVLLVLVIASMVQANNPEFWHEWNWFRNHH